MFLKSFERLGAELGNRVIFHGARNFDGPAADFAVFDIDLPADRKVHDHRDLLAAVGTIEKVFHVERASFEPGE
jgi:hypothetical protein